MQLPPTKMQTRDYMIYHLMYTADYIKKKKKVFFFCCCWLHKDTIVFLMCVIQRFLKQSTQVKFDA